MAGLSDVVNINLVTQSAAVKQPSFGVPLLLAGVSEFTEHSRRYTSLDGMVADGFSSTSPGYRMAAKLLAQNPQVESFRIGRRANAPTMQIKLTPVAASNTAFTLDVEGVTKSFTSGSGATTAQIATGISLALGSIPGWAVATADGGTTITLTSITPGAVLSVRPWNIALIGLAQTHADAGLAADLDAIHTETGDWYGFSLSTASKAEVLAAAAWIEARKRLAGFTLNDTLIATSAASGATDVGASLLTSNYARSFSVFAEDTCEYSGAALLGNFLPTLPGSATAKFKTLASVRSSNLTASQYQNILDRNVNLHTDFGGVAMVTEGKIAVGEFIDVVRDSDWFNSRMRTELFLLLKNAPKIPYTDAGLVRIEGVLRAVGREGEASGFLVPGSFTVTMPKVSDVATSSKSVRDLPGITYRGAIAGAIHKLSVSGTLTLS